ncbi:MAG: alpha/beta hydrolase [Candidatus Taylorbacteria bacterium]
MTDYCSSLEKIQGVLPRSTLTFIHNCPPQNSITCSCPLLFIPGMGGSAEQFELSTNIALRFGLETYALNLRDHGPGETPQASSIHDYANDIVCMLLHIGRPTIIVGHSIAGLAAQMVAEKFSTSMDDSSEALVKGLVLLSSSPPAGIPFFIRRMLYLPYLWAWLIPPYSTFRMKEKHVLKLFMNQTPNANKYAQNLKLASGLAVWELAMGKISVDEKKVCCPSLVIAPTEDRAVSLKIQRAVAVKYRPNSAYCEVPGDHMAFMWSNGPIDEVIRWVQLQKWFYPGVDVFPRVEPAREPQVTRK